MRCASLLTILAAIAVFLSETKVGVALFDAGIKRLVAAMPTLNNTEFADIVLQAVVQDERFKQFASTVLSHGVNGSATP